jgi:hypothetical protein
MSTSDLTIAFSEGHVEPLGKYGFDLDLSGQSGCDVIEHLLFLVQSLEHPYQIIAGGDPVRPTELSRDYSRLTVWTNDQNNAGFLLLMSELGVEIQRPDGDASA